eukprot:1838194-Pyramimonas_sp.AAC.1
MPAGPRTPAEELSGTSVAKRPGLATWPHQTEFAELLVVCTAWSQNVFVWGWFVRTHRAHVLRTALLFLERFRVLRELRGRPGRSVRAQTLRGELLGIGGHRA